MGRSLKELKDDRLPELELELFREGVIGLGDKDPSLKDPGRGRGEIKGFGLKSMNFSSQLNE